MAKTKELSIRNVELFGRVPAVDPIYKLNDYAYLAAYNAIQN